MTHRLPARFAGALTAAALVLGAAACSEDPNSVAAQAKAGDQKGYISGDGTVMILRDFDKADLTADDFSI